MMHDIISDVLAADTIPHDRKREVIYAQLDELRDSTRNVMSWDEWRNMGEAMGGVAVMGGPATGLIETGPTPMLPASGTQHGGHRQEVTPPRGEAADSSDGAPHQHGAPLQPADSAATADPHRHPQ
jgi:hypothetical protein